MSKKVWCVWCGCVHARARWLFLCALWYVLDFFCLHVRACVCVFASVRACVRARASVPQGVRYGEKG